ncbi:MAG: hypothetical protein OXK76_16300 [Gammaproteobacteria bacterium]|nr:hypothetical protein [Gammaproteobacteria bacterium]
MPGPQRRDPLAETRAVTSTCREATQSTFDENRVRWRGGGTAKHMASWLGFRPLECRAFAVLAELPVDAIGRQEILKVLTPIWSTLQETARRERQGRTMFGWAMAHRHVQTRSVRGSTALCRPCRR